MGSFRSHPETNGAADFAATATCTAADAYSEPARLTRPRDLRSVSDANLGRALNRVCQ